MRSSLERNFGPNHCFLAASSVPGFWRFWHFPVVIRCLLCCYGGSSLVMPDACVDSFFGTTGRGLISYFASISPLQFELFVAIWDLILQSAGEGPPFLTWKVQHVPGFSSRCRPFGSFVSSVTPWWIRVVSRGARVPVPSSVLSVSRSSSFGRVRLLLGTDVWQHEGERTQEARQPFKVGFDLISQPKPICTGGNFQSASDDYVCVVAFDLAHVWRVGKMARGVSSVSKALKTTKVFRLSAVAG